MAKLSVLIVHGPRHHGWPELPAALKAVFAATGRFNVEVSISPPLQASQGEWEAWRPPFSDFEAVVQISEGRLWSDALRADFEAYMNAGGGAMVLHSAVAAFEEWEEYKKIIGMGNPWKAWQSISTGYRIFIDDATGEVVRTPPFHGIGPGHGKRHAFPVKSRRPDHPIMRGIPYVWLHGEDELYHVMRGPAENIDILASAYSAKDQRGTGEHEPVLWTVTQGRSRVVASVLGHGPESVYCVGHQTLLARGVEWAATGAVTIPVPKDFPNKDESSVISPGEVLWSSE